MSSGDRMDTGIQQVLQSVLTGPLLFHIMTFRITLSVQTALTYLSIPGLAALFCTAVVSSPIKDQRTILGKQP